jgi:hypothetical protein
MLVVILAVILAINLAISLAILSAVNLASNPAIIRAGTPAVPTLDLADDLLDRWVFYTLAWTCQTLIRPVDGAFRCARLA